jgi:hypothetical protein
MRHDVAYLSTFPLIADEIGLGPRQKIAPPSCLSFGPTDFRCGALHPPAHILICTGGCALQLNYIRRTNIRRNLVELFLAATYGVPMKIPRETFLIFSCFFRR